jgi:hypothetical protein
MKRIAWAAVPLLALAALGATSAVATPAKKDLAGVLAGRTAGKPVSCIDQKTIDSSKIVDNAIIYRMKFGPWYVNKPDKGRCTLLQPERQLITRTTGTQLCRLDSVTISDLTAGIQYGACTLGDFVPYTKAK